MNNTRVTTFIFFLLITFDFYAQNVGDTIYYDGNWKQTVERDSAKYYRVIDKIKQGIVYVKDYYLSGGIQMTGSFDADNEKVGDFLYYNELGKITSRISYIKNTERRKEYSYYKTGKLLAETEYLNGKKDGWFITYFINGKVKRKDKYKNGEFISGDCYARDGKKLNINLWKQKQNFREDMKP